MERSKINSAYFTALFGSIIFLIWLAIFREFSVWNILLFVVVFIIIKLQNYLYQKDDKTYFRRVPFFRGILIEKLKGVEDLRLIDSSTNIVKLWQLIKLKNQRQAI